MNPLPATPDALNDVDDGHLPPAGLERVFAVGEKIPWKGLWFEIEQLTPERILLKPIGETWKHHKARTGK